MTNNDDLRKQVEMITEINQEACGLLETLKAIAHVMQSINEHAEQLPSADDLEDLDRRVSSIAAEMQSINE